MSARVFAVVCPDCGGEMPSDEAGQHICGTCGTTYVTRFGYLIAQRTVSRVTPHAEAALS